MLFRRAAGAPRSERWPGCVATGTLSRPPDRARGKINVDPRSVAVTSCARANPQMKNGDSPLWCFAKTC
jgi:hypothetical protein